MEFLELVQFYYFLSGTDQVPLEKVYLFIFPSSASAWVFYRSFVISTLEDISRRNLGSF